MSFLGTGQKKGQVHFLEGHISSRPVPFFPCGWQSQAAKIVATMPRSARLICPGLPHHLTYRGNRRQDIFLDEDDRRLYLRILVHCATAEQVKIHAYCLMGNHAHLIVTPPRADSLPQLIHRAHLRYAQYANERHAWSGHLFASRYYSAPLDDPHYWEAMRYVERNPVRAGLVRLAQEWPWSSARAHCGLGIDLVLSDVSLPGWPPAKWSAWLRGEDPDQVDLVRRATRAGRPCGGADFVAGLESRVGRRLVVRDKGRPRKDTPQLPTR